MKPKRYNFKKLIFSLLPLSLMASIFPVVVSQTNSNNPINSFVDNSTFQNKSKSNSKATTVDLALAPIPSDGIAVMDNTITSFDTYTPAYEDPNISLVSAMNGTIGMTSNKQTITFTTYDGLLLWSNKITENVLIQKFYKQKLNINDISSYTVINYIYLESSNVLLVLFGLDAKTSKTSGLSNEIIFGIDIKSGSVYSQPNNDSIDFSDEKNIFKVNNGINTLNYLSNGNVVASTGGVSSRSTAVANDIPRYDNTNNTLIIQFDLNRGFGYFDAGTYWNNTVNENAYFWGIAPVSQNRNYVFFIDLNNTDSNIDKTVVDENGNESPVPGIQYFNGAAYSYCLVDDNLRLVNNTISNGTSTKSLMPITGAYFGSFMKNPTDFSLNLTKRMYNAGDGTVLLWTDNDEYKQLNGICKLSFNKTDNTTTTTFTKVDGKQGSASTINSNGYSTKVTYDKETKNLIYCLYGTKTNGQLNTYIQTYSVTRNKITNKSRWLQRKVPYQLVPINNTDVNTSSSAHVVFLSYVDSTWTGIFRYQNWTGDVGDVFETTGDSTVAIKFKKLNEVHSNILNSPLYKEKLPSNLTVDELKAFVNFTDPSSATTDYTINVSNVVANDNLGTLSFSYSISYQQQLKSANNTDPNPGKTSFTFEGKVSVEGMYALDTDLSFMFITKNSPDGDATIDNKFLQINNLKSKNIPSTITKQNIKDSFISYSIKDKNGNSLQIVDDYITLTANDNDGTLKIDIVIPSNLMPLGISADKLTYSQTYTGFISLSGFTKAHINDSENITELKKVKYASEVSLHDILNNFVTLGPSYTNATNDWTYEINKDLTNNYTGTLSFRLIYKSSALPTGVSDDIKNVFATPTTWHTISGFKVIYENFEAAQNLSIEEYSGLMSAQEIVDDYKTNGNKSIFFDFLKRNQLQWSKALYIEDNVFDNLEYNLTPSTDGKYIDIKVGYKLNTNTNLLIGADRFVFDSVAKQNFESHFQGQYPFSVKWNINYYQSNFEWTEYDYSSSNSPIVEKTQDNLTIDLTINSYGSINKEMFASDVTDQEIEQLFSIENYVIQSGIQKTVNSQDGTLVIKFTLMPQQTEGLVLDSNISRNQKALNKQLEKTIYITGFKLSTPLVVEVVPIVIASICGLLIISTVGLILYRNKQRNNSLYLKNIKKKRK